MLTTTIASAVVSAVLVEVAFPLIRRICRVTRHYRRMREVYPAMRAVTAAAIVITGGRHPE